MEWNRNGIRMLVTFVALAIWNVGMIRKGSMVYKIVTLMIFFVKNDSHKTMNGIYKKTEQLLRGQFSHSLQNSHDEVVWYIYLRNAIQWP